MLSSFGYGLFALLLAATSGSDWQEAAAQLLEARLELDKAQKELTAQRQIQLQSRQNWQLELEQQKLQLSKAILVKKAQEKELTVVRENGQKALKVHQEERQEILDLISAIDTTLLKQACFPQKRREKLAQITRLLQQDEIMPHEAGYMLATFFHEQKLEGRQITLKNLLVTLPEEKEMLLPVLSFGNTLFYVKDAQGYGLFYQQAEECRYFPIREPAAVNLIQQLFILTGNNRQELIDTVVLP